MDGMVETENLGRYINTPNNDYGYKLIEDSTTYAVFHLRGLKIQATI